MTALKCYVATHRLPNKYDRIGLLHLLSIRWKNFLGNLFLKFFPKSVLSVTLIYKLDMS